MTSDRGRPLVIDLDAGEPFGAVPGTVSGMATDGFGPIVIGVTSVRSGEELVADPRVADSRCDLVFGAGDPLLAQVQARIAANPIASSALVLLLRQSEGRSLEDGLLAESATYSSLQAGPEFAAWLERRPCSERHRDGPPIHLQRSGGRLDITLTRPRVGNALNAAMRDELLEALALVAADPSISEVHLSGEGRHFCTGGDLDEFGTLADPASAHLLRLSLSIGAAIAGVAERLTAHLHGACVGSGIELPAFAGTVLATADTTFTLPEISLGLIPGAGGTVSVVRRIGRQRTARLALTGERINAPTALAWGLVDGLED